MIGTITATYTTFETTRTETITPRIENGALVFDIGRFAEANARVEISLQPPTEPTNEELSA